MKATVTAVREGSTVTATWTAPDQYQYIWAACTAAGYEQWVAVRSESWEQSPLVFTGVPAGATVALMAPRMVGQRRVWRTLATATV
jgi:hypothetical protein